MAPKKMTQKELQKQAEKEEEQRQKQQQAAKKPVEQIKIVKVEKKAVLSTQDIKKKVEEEKRKKQQEEELKRQEEQRKLLEEQMRIEAEQQRIAQKEEKKRLKQQKKRDEFGVQALIDDDMGEEEKAAAIDELLFLLTAEQNEKKQKEKEERDKERQVVAEATVAQKKNDNDWGAEISSDSDVFGDNGKIAKKVEKAPEKKEVAQQNELRSPIVCVLGHVDTGKTSILDKIRSSTVQQREEGGITQQIGATFLSAEFLKEKTKTFPLKVKYEVPGLLIVDTPGHESFSNLRNRGSSLSDITILVIDIMHGVEPQTIESINIMKARNAPFVVALNKIDRLYAWKPVESRDSKASIEQQTDGCKNDFDLKFAAVQQQLGDQGFFSDFWWKVSNLTEVVPIIPTSAVTGEGLCDLLAILVQYSQQLMRERLTYTDETQCTILEVRKTEGFGFTLDCILVNGMIKRGQKIVIAGQQGPITSTIRNLLTPQEAKEIREASAADYKRHDELKAAIGCKIAGEGLEMAVAGSTVYICEEEEDEEILRDAVMDELKEGIVKANSQFGVAVHGNSLGAIEALVGYLRSENTKVQRDPVNVSLVTVGPVTKQTLQEMALQHEKGHPECAVVLAFDVDIAKDIAEKAKELRVHIIHAKIIYHLYDRYVEFVQAWHEAEKLRLKDDICIPCIVKPIVIIHNRDPVLIGVRVIKGVLQVKQKLVLVDGSQNGKQLGFVAGIENNKVAQKEAKPGEEVAVRIDTADNYLVGKGGLFDIGATLCTALNRQRLEILKLHFREELKEWVGVVKEMKELLRIQ